MEAAEENLKTLRDEKREFCLLDVAIVFDDVREGGHKTFTVQFKRTKAIHPGLGRLQSLSRA